jgi:hypothetical protein
MIDKMKYLQITLAAMLCMAAFSCNRDELFEREQYKNVFALLSDDGYNIFAEEHDLRNTQSSGNVSAVCGGSLPTTQDITVRMKEDHTILARYNTSNYDVEEDKYARLLPAEKYEIRNLNITIPAGERKGLMEIVLRPHGLSPDSMYFIPLRADRFSAYELNPKKSYVMYRVLMKNYYATQTKQKASTDYNLRGKRNGANTMGIKPVFPIAADKVRIMAGDITFEAKKDVINRSAILLSVDSLNRVHISPWKDIKVTQIDDDKDYPNIFRIDDDGYKTYKTFLLRYDYVHNGTTYKMQEELRLEFKQENEKK